MPGEYLKGFPDPPNSPNEKFLLPQTPHLWQDDLYRDLINNGCPHDLALAISRSIAQHEDRKAISEQHKLRTLEWWANIHTHPGGTGGEGVWSPFYFAPFRLVKIGTNAYYSLDNGYTWASAANGGQSSSGGRILWLSSGEDTGYAVRPHSFRFQNDSWDENVDYSLFQTEVTSTNTNDCRNIAVDPDTGLAVIVGGEGGANISTHSPRAWYNVGPDYRNSDEWVSIANLGTDGHGRIQSVIFAKEGYFVAVGGFTTNVWRSNPEDISDWERVDVLPEACMDIMYHKGRLFAASGYDNSNTQTTATLYVSDDGGNSWSSFESKSDFRYGYYPGGLYSNGQVLLVPTSNGLYRLDEDTDSLVYVPPPSGSVTESMLGIGWDGVTWLVATGDGELRLSEDPLAGDDSWELVGSWGSSFLAHVM